MEFLPKPVSPELTIPRSHSEDGFIYVIFAIVVIFSAIAIINLFNAAAVVASVVWLGVVILMVGNGICNAGGLRGWLVDRLGDLAGRRFAAIADEPGLRTIKFGFEFLGHRFTRQSIAVGKIESVE